MPGLVKAKMILVIELIIIYLMKTEDRDNVIYSRPGMTQFSRIDK